jgi:hypothetical protein
VILDTCATNWSSLDSSSGVGHSDLEGAGVDVVVSLVDGLETI